MGRRTTLSECSGTSSNNCLKFNTTADDGMHLKSHALNNSASLSGPTAVRRFYWTFIESYVLLNVPHLNCDSFSLVRKIK